MSKEHKITLIPGDGIGPEVVQATLKIIQASGVKITWEECEAGAAVFKKGLASGVPQETIDSINRNRVVLKGPLETPIGFGEKSANVTLRKLFETYANIRPVKEYPGVTTPFSGRGVDFVIVRENVEDLYAGIEYMQTPTTAQCLKLITEKGSEKIIRLAFELARSEQRKSVHCVTKANIMKFTEGMMQKVFRRVAPEYPEIQAEEILVDNCAHQLVRLPESFDVLVTTNMNGDILSDLGSGLVGGLGFAPGANIGYNIAIFEAVHGSAPKYAGKNVVNPLAVLFSGLMMLRYLGEFKAADTIEQAVYVTLGTDNVLTQDVTKKGKGVTTTAFTDHIIGNLGKTYDKNMTRAYKPLNVPAAKKLPVSPTPEINGIDIFIQSEQHPKDIGPTLEKISADSALKLKMISNRGVIVYPDPGILPDIVDHFRCRFIRKDAQHILTNQEIVTLLEAISKEYTWMHIEKLNIIDGEAGYSKAQGES